MHRPAVGGAFALCFVLGCGGSSRGRHNGSAQRFAGGRHHSAVDCLGGEDVVGDSGCLACHVLGDNGNNGPGPPLTHIGSILRPDAIASTLRNPTAPMPSFAGLANNDPKKFQNLVTFLSELQ